MYPKLFTDGPWAVEAREGHADGPRFVITAKAGYFGEPRETPIVDRIAVISQNGGAESPKANADAIAALPDLFISLHAIEEYILQEAGYAENSFNKALQDCARDALTLASSGQAPEKPALLTLLGSMRSALEAVLNSDMAQREEDEGNVSPVLERLREILGKPLKGASS